MPTDEFFNTGIYTYLWVFNKNKQSERKDRVILINASELYEPLKKSKGKKRRQMNPRNQAEIVKAFTDFRDNAFSKVFDKWHFYYNRQSILLTNVDINGKFIEMPRKENRAGELVEEKSIRLNPVRITASDERGTTTIDTFEITGFDAGRHATLEAFFNEEIKPRIANLDPKENKLKVMTANATFWYDEDKETIIEEAGGKQTELGCGKIIVKAAFKKATKSKKACIVITAEMTKDLQKDYEIVPYSPDETENRQWIADFMTKYVTKPFEYLDNVIGVEINFNKVFYTPEKLREVSEITADLEALEKKLADFEKELSL
jgi:type I restriction enzyme M protein